MPQYTFSEAFKQRFWNHVQKTSDDSCWPWMLSLGGHGYGQVRNGSTTHLTHRVAYELTYGSIPADMWVLHKCDNQPCCNPTHLFLGTHTDNMQDMLSKGRNMAKVCPERQARGDRHVSRTHPEVLPRGDKHYLRLHPEKARRGEVNNKARFTEQQVRDIRQQYEQGVSMRELARIYQAARKSIQAIVKRRSWRHVE